MKKIFSEKFPRVIKNKKNLEKELNVKLKVDGTEITIDGESVDEYIAEKVITAIDFGFPLSVALMLKDDEYVFESLNIKDYTKKTNLVSVRARIIGKGGKTIKTLSDLTKCYFEIKDNQVGIVGNSEDIQNALQSIISIAQGSKQSNVYHYLEKHHPMPIFDLGLKEEKK